MRFLAAVSCAVFLSGCVATTPTERMVFVPTAYLVDVEQSYIDDNIKKVRDSMKDPESAQFSGIYTTRRVVDQVEQPNANVCGYVNAKNSYGGYVGKTRFLSSAGFVAVWEPNPRHGFSIDNTVIRDNCTLRAGEPMPAGYPG